jgi:hypothetical protein
VITLIGKVALTDGINRGTGGKWLLGLTRG